MPDRMFETYRLLVEEARDARRARRELSNMFLTMNLAGVGALGLIAGDRLELKDEIFFGCAFALALTCIIWSTTNGYYRNLLRTKYGIIGDIEKQLGPTPITDEYKKMKERALRAFLLERWMPWLFILFYVGFCFLQASSFDGFGVWISDLFNAIVARFQGS